MGKRAGNRKWEVGSGERVFQVRLEVNHIVISIKIENINPRVHKDFVGLDCIRLI